MTSSTSTRSTFSGISEGWLSEAGSSRLQNRSSAEESQEDCPKCAALRLNTVIAEEALASLSGQFKNLQKELKKTEQVSKINEEQAKYIDERRSKLENLEAEHTSLYAEYENLRITHDSLKRQYDEVVATARRNQRLIEESVKYHETCKVAVENLMAEKEARQELLAKYLKSVEAAAKINDSMKQLEKKCVQLQAMNEKLEPFRYHCPAMLRLLLEFGEIIENNGLMTKSLQRRLARYKDKDDLREYLLRKSRRLTNLSESSTKTIEESSDDDELAKDVEHLLLTAGSPLHPRSPKKSVSPNEELRNDEKTNDHSTNPVKETSNIGVEKENFLRKQLENVEDLHMSFPRFQFNSDTHMEEAKAICKRQLKLTEKQKIETLYVEKKKVDDVVSICFPSTLSSSLAKKNKQLVGKDVQESEDGLQKNIVQDMCENNSKIERDKNMPEVEVTFNSIVYQNNEEKQVCRSTERLSTWLSFVHLDPLLPELNRPTFLDNETELSKQHSSVDFMDNLFGSSSPSTSSRRTSVGSTESCMIPKNKTGMRSELSCSVDAVLTTEETSFLTEPLSLPLVSSSSVYSSVTGSIIPVSEALEDSSSLCRASVSITETGTNDERPGNESVENHRVSDEITEIPFVEALVPTIRQRLRPKTTDSKSVRISVTEKSSQRKRSGFNSPNGNESFRIRVASPKLPKVITESSSTKEDELDENQGFRMQSSRSEKMISGGAVFGGKTCSEKDGNLVRLSEGKVESVLKMLAIKNAELKTIQNEQEFERCVDNPASQEQPLHSTRMEQLQIDSFSSKHMEELSTDSKELINVQNDLRTEDALMQRENANTKPGETVGIRNDNNIALHRRSQKDWDLNEMKSLKNNRKILKRHEIPGTIKLGNEVGKKKNIHALGTRVQQEMTLRNELENTKIAVESLSKNEQNRESKKLTLTRNNQVTCESRKRKLAEEGCSNTEDEWKDGDQTTASLQKSKMIETDHEKEPVSEDNECTMKSTTLNIKSLRTELSDDDGDGNRLEIVADEVELSHLNIENASGAIHVSNNFEKSEKTKRTTVVTKKSVSIMRSEMYKKMHRRLAVQTSCMKEIGRVQGRKFMGNKAIPTLSTSKKIERPNISQQRKTAVMVPTGRDELKKAKNVGLPVIQHGVSRESLSSTKVANGSDDAAVMCLFDQAISESNYDDKLLEIIQKFQTPAISVISCEKLAECCVKFISKLDVGNMWHSVVLAVRYWSGKQRYGCTAGEVLELHQVASSKERNFIEVLHQLSGEVHWNDVISFFLWKMIISVMKTRPVSAAQHGLSIRCVLLCTRILLQDGSNNEVLRKVTNLLQHLIERDSPDRVVPMMCYSIAIVPEIVDKLLLEDNEQYEPVRRVMSVHLASRDELFTIFNKVIMSRLLNKNTYSTTCLQKLSIHGFQNWFTESINVIITDINGLNLESMELSSRLSSAMMTCYALFSLATNRLVPDKEAIVFPVLNECVQIISNHFESEKKGGNEMFVDTVGLQLLSDDTLVKTVLRLLLFGRLITSFVRSTDCSTLLQIANLVEEIHRLRELTRLKLEQRGKTASYRLLYFGLNDWLQIVKPWTNFLPADFTVASD
ncbi:Uncharacterized protein BM_BM10844 [Brugia malayi]|uniref:Bm10844 n=1 Tax=Brugia malayi TaxID=6279 RepID=A0A0K0IPQ3_BRUMA|nr:Uncharacterized protein BM_BM10844 [Brugia malayi]CRZ25665.1 Bm10844 [Brugia malayi]VIO91563.1 Uncharacterized protein BM_BM10844 [Brugia malayi]